MDLMRFHDLGAWAAPDPPPHPPPENFGRGRAGGRICMFTPPGVGGKNRPNPPPPKNFQIGTPWQADPYGERD
jgi:hypothetical protein